MANQHEELKTAQTRCCNSIPRRARPLSRSKQREQVLVVVWVFHTVGVIWTGEQTAARQRDPPGELGTPQEQRHTPHSHGSVFSSHSLSLRSLHSYSQCMNGTFSLTPVELLPLTSKTHAHLKKKKQSKEKKKGLLLSPTKSFPLE